MHAVPVHDPLGRLIEGRFGVLADGATAVVETAEASGLARLNAEERNPLIASSYGTGELLLAAARLGVRRIIVGLGGSATNDAGAGLLQSLGVRLLDANGDELGRGGAALVDVSVIDITTMDPVIGNVSIIAALAHFARLVAIRLGVDVSDVPGAGAAGGIGAALKGFFGAEFRSGVDIVIVQSGFDEAVRWADVVFTGEGAIDAQTGFGKAPAGVAGAAKRYGKPVVAVAGCVGGGIDELYGLGIDAVFGIAPGASSLNDLLADAAANVTRTTEQIVRVMRMK